MLCYEADQPTHGLSIVSFRLLVFSKQEPAMQMNATLAVLSLTPRGVFGSTSIAESIAAPCVKSHNPPVINPSEHSWVEVEFQYPMRGP